MSDKRLIDGDKLIECIEEEIASYPISQSQYAMGSRQMNVALLKELKSGRFDIPSNQEEAARLREAIKRIKQYAINEREKKLGPSWIDLIIAASEDSEALSSHTEDTKPTEPYAIRCLMEIKSALRTPNWDEDWLEDKIDACLAGKETGIQKVREPVKWFAEQMEQTLRANDHKGGWDNCSLDWLIERLYQESGELWKAIRESKLMKESNHLTEGEILRITYESTDVANFAMMIADNARRSIPGITDGGDNNA